MAVAALTSCTQSEVLEVAQSRVIGFDTFVGKNTRATQINQTGPQAPTTKDNLYQFWVFGYENTEQTFNATDEKAKVYYNATTAGFTYDKHQIWTLGATYNFAAYSNANKPLVTDATESTEVTATTSISVTHTLLDSDDLTKGSKLEFTDYTVGEDDLLAAITKPTTLAATATTVGDVPLIFDHLLSCVHFSIQNNSTELYLQINDIVVPGITQDNCTYQIAKGADSKYTRSCTWGNTVATTAVTADGSYTFSNKINIDNSEKNYLAPGATLNMSCFVIPQSTTEKVNIEVTSQTYTKDGDVYTATTSENTVNRISLAINDDVHKVLQPGYQYNYVLTLSGSAHYIHFDPSVTDWETYGSTTSINE